VKKNRAGYSIPSRGKKKSRTRLLKGKEGKKNIIRFLAVVHEEKRE